MTEKEIWDLANSHGMEVGEDNDGQLIIYTGVYPRSPDE